MPARAPVDLLVTTKPTDSRASCGVGVVLTDMVGKWIVVPATNRFTCAPASFAARVVAGVAYSSHPQRFIADFAPCTWSPCSCVTRQASIESGLTPIVLRRPASVRVP